MGHVQMSPKRKDIIMIAEPTSKHFSRLLMAEEEETKGIARELHHDLAQSLYKIKSDLGEAIHQVKNNQINAGIESVESVIFKIQEITTQIQTIGMHLWPPTLDDMGIMATISWFCREFKRTHSGISVSTEINIQESDVPESLKHVIYKILKEALNNIASRSKATLVCLFFSKRKGTVELTIQDNGEAFDMKREDLAGSRLVFALDSIRERTEIAGGSFAIESVIGKGTTIRALWPIRTVFR
jgi:signal transduction histidine kinase